jgi:hypothetical protein
VEYTTDTHTTPRADSVTYRWHDIAPKLSPFSGDSQIELTSI